jgi:DNA-binding CsgD family transcriptional regulator
MRAELAAALGDAVAAEAGYRLLLPHAALHVAGGAGVITTCGAVGAYAGLAALAAGRPDTAVRLLRPAVADNDAAGLVPFAALARHHLARALLARGRAADADEAGAVARAATEAADRLGMVPLRRRLADLAGAVRDGGVLSRRETGIAELVARGLTNRQIAADAGISERTVETHVQHVLAKLGFSRRAEIAAWVARPRAVGSAPVRLVIARCQVDYVGRLTAHLPMAPRLLLVKADGSVSIHADDRAYKPLNWMSPPCWLTEEPGVWTVRNKADESLVITIDEVLHDSTHELGVDPGLVKDGVEAHLQELLAAHPRRSARASRWCGAST